MGAEGGDCALDRSPATLPVTIPVPPPQTTAPAGHRLPLHCQDMARWVHIIQRVWSCGRQLRKWLADQLAPWQLSDSQFLLLFSCGQSYGEGVAQQDLSAALDISPARISGLVEELAARELVCLSRPAQDRRRQLVQLTTRGARLLETILGTLSPLASRLEPDEVAGRRDAALDWLGGCYRAAG